MSWFTGKPDGQPPNSAHPPAGGEAAELRSILASMQDGLIVYDRNFRVSLFNAAAEKIFALKADDLLGQVIGPQQAEDPNLRRLVHTPLANDAGNVSGFMKIIRDGTHEMALSKSKTEFTAVASHQLRTPSTNIEWTLEELAGNSNLDENSKALLANAQSSARQLKMVVEDLLNISRIEEGRFG